MNGLYKRVPDKSSIRYIRYISLNMGGREALKAFIGEHNLQETGPRGIATSAEGNQIFPFGYVSPTERYTVLDPDLLSNLSGFDELPFGPAEFKFYGDYHTKGMDGLGVAFAEYAEKSGPNFDFTVEARRQSAEIQYFGSTTKVENAIMLGPIGLEYQDNGDIWLIMAANADTAIPNISDNQLELGRQRARMWRQYSPVTINELVKTMGTINGIELDLENERQRKSQRKSWTPASSDMKRVPVPVYCVFKNVTILPHDGSVPKPVYKLVKTEDGNIEYAAHPVFSNSGVRYESAWAKFTTHFSPLYGGIALGTSSVNVVRPASKS